MSRSSSRFRPRLAVGGSLLLGALLLVVAGCVRAVDTPPKSVVFFNAFSAELDAPALGVIKEFSDDAKTAPRRPVIVAGYADSTGSRDANVMLSALRAKVVADALVASGIAADRIVQRGRGPTTLDPGIESRRVEMELGTLPR